MVEEINAILNAYGKALDHAITHSDNLCEKCIYCKAPEEYGENEPCEQYEKDKEIACQEGVMEYFMREGQNGRI